MKARVFVTLKPGVLDPQGKAIHHALEGLGFGGVTEVRAGKLIELELADGTSDDEIADMCRKLLANTAIENFKIEKLENEISHKLGFELKMQRLQISARCEEMKKLGACKKKAC